MACLKGVALGAALSPGDTTPFPYRQNNPYAGRLEGQWIWQEANSMVRLNLHAFEGSTYCQVFGTAEIVATS
jgi:hypothetical protein